MNKRKKIFTGQLENLLIFLESATKQHNNTNLNILLVNEIFLARQLSHVYFVLITKTPKIKYLYLNTFHTVMSVLFNRKTINVDNAEFPQLGHEYGLDEA